MLFNSVRGGPQWWRRVLLINTYRRHWEFIVYIEVAHALTNRLLATNLTPKNTLLWPGTTVLSQHPLKVRLKVPTTPWSHSPTDSWHTDLCSEPRKPCTKEVSQARLGKEKFFSGPWGKGLSSVLQARLLGFLTELDFSHLSCDLGGLRPTSVEPSEEPTTPSNLPFLTDYTDRVGWGSSGEGWVLWRQKQQNQISLSNTFAMV